MRFWYYERRIAWFCCGVAPKLFECAIRQLRSNAATEPRYASLIILKPHSYGYQSHSGDATSPKLALGLILYRKNIILGY